jgi:ferrous iron transport protein B
MNSEIKSKKWLFAGLGLQFSIAYVMSFLIYQLGTLFTEGKLGSAFVPGLIFVVAIISAVVFLGISSNAKAMQENAAKKNKAVAVK